MDSVRGLEIIGPNFTRLLTVRTENCWSEQTLKSQIFSGETIVVSRLFLQINTLSPTAERRCIINMLKRRSYFYKTIGC